MTLLRRLVVCALLVSLSLIALRCSPKAADPVAETLDRYLTTRTELGRFSGAVLAVRDGRTVLRKGYGFADIEKRTPYEPDTRQPVASISKMFTAMAVLKLRDQGRLGLDDPICKHLPECPEAWAPVTIRHLLLHQSGIPDYESRLELGSQPYFDFMTRLGASAAILADAKQRPLEFEPGTSFRYSNTGYIALGFVIEKAAGVPFTELVTKTLLEPVSMRDSGVLGGAQRPDRLASGYTYDKLDWGPMLRGVSLSDGHLSRVPELALTPPAGDAWLYSTVDDLERWSRAMEGSETVPAALAAEAATPGLSGYGFGWFLDEAFDRKRMHHNGIVPGYLSELIRFPDERITIVLLSNLDRVRLSTVARDVSAIVLGKPFDMPVRGDTIELTEEQIARLVGDYATDGGKTLKVRKEPDFLIAELTGQYTAGLIPLSETEMYFPMGDGKAIFTLGADGRAAQINMRYAGEDHVARRATSP